MSNPILDGLFGIVNLLSGIAHSYGQPFANFINGIVNLGIDANMGSFLLTFILAGAAFKFINSQPIKFAATIIGGALIFSLLASPQNTIVNVMNQTSNLTG